MISRTELIELYRTLALIRRFEERSGLDADALGGAAVVAGTVRALGDGDHLVAVCDPTAHRIAMGADLRATIQARSSLTPIAELDDGLRLVAAGFDRAIELGRALADRDSSKIVWCAFGEDLIPRGEFHEALNVAAVDFLPIVFVCENNFYGLGTLFDAAVCQEDLYRFVAGYKMPALRVDGGDVQAVHFAAREAASHVRAGDGPAFIDACTYHPRGKGSEPPGFKPPHEESVLRARDPLTNFRAQVVVAHAGIEAELDEIDRIVDAALAQAFKA
jgi:TPP-dependent pyruvate/acetoin dehydrogenase alpha subunit